MDATITNLSSAPVFLTGPKVELAASGDADGNDARVWPDVTIHDLDSDSQLKSLVVAGTVSVSVAPVAEDGAVAVQGTMQHSSSERYLVANLPTGFDGRRAYAIDGRKVGEGAAAGTGVEVVFSDGEWRIHQDDSVVLA